MAETTAQLTQSSSFDETQLINAIQTIIDLNVQEQTRTPAPVFKIEAESWPSLSESMGPVKKVAPKKEDSTIATRAEPPTTESKSPTKKDGKRIPPMQRAEMGEKVFGEVDKQNVVEFFLAVMNYFHRFYDSRPYLKDWETRNGMKLHHIMAQSFLCWYNKKTQGRNFPRREGRRDKNSKQTGPTPNGIATVQEPQLETSTAQNSIFQENGVVLTQHETNEPLKEEIEANDELVEPMDESLGPLESLETSNLEESVEPQADQSIQTEGEERPSDSNVQAPRIITIEPPLTDEQKWAILRCLIPIDFPVRNRFLKLVMQTLGFTKESTPKIVDMVLEMAEVGQASYSTLYYCMREQEWNNYVKSPAIIIRTLILGPLSGEMVEFFLRNKNDKFREDAKNLILHAERMTQDPIAFETTVRQWLHSTVDRVPPYQQFCNNVHDLMRELRKEPPRCNLIDVNWARHAVKRAIRRYYSTKEFTEEQMNDVVHTILVQRPELKGFVLSVLSKEFKDEVAVTRWRKFYPQRNDRTRIPGYYLQVDMYSNSDGYLTIPHGVQVLTLNKVDQLKFMEMEIAKISQSDYPIVGIDAEWDSYVHTCRACLLQIAFKNTIYLVDLEAMRTKPEFTRFVQDFFASQSFIKIGFQFGEDLLQIRNTISKAVSLYRPENVVCIGKLIEQLLIESGRRPDINIEEFFQNVDDGKDILSQDSSILSASVEAEYDALEGPVMASGTTLVIDDEDDKKAKLAESKKVSDSIKRLGLSAICKRLLGKSLEKSEQCSVWDRRPLRFSQIRYAALDAYCILMLYDKCVEWANRLGLNISDMMLAQPKIYCPLPLFWDGPK